MPKRSVDGIDVDDVMKSVNLDKGLVDGLLDLNRDELAAVLADIANKAHISTATFKNARTDLPSFSTAKWFNFAIKFGLPLNPSRLQLTPFSTPRYCLPLSFQKTMFENAWRWQDVYREMIVQTSEEARLRILEPYIVPIVALFQGRVIDMPEQAMTETKYSTGGEVEHELKVSPPDANALAQLFLKLLSAAEVNKSIDFAGLRIYGLLTDLLLFKFYSYDPTARKFCFDETIIIANKRPSALVDMIDVSNKIFGLVISAYLEGLRVTIKNMIDRARGNDFSSMGSSPEVQTRPGNPLSELEPSKLTSKGKKKGGCKSTDQWEVALGLAQRCCDKFDEPVTSVEDIENKGNEALALLIQSVHCIPRASAFTGIDDNHSTPAMLEALAYRLVNETYVEYV